MRASLARLRMQRHSWTRVEFERRLASCRIEQPASFVPQSVAAASVRPRTALLRGY